MKNFKIIPVVFLAFCLFMPLYNIKAEEADDEYKVNSKFKTEEIKLKPETFILDYKYEDVNGDNIRDDIILVGNKEEDAASPWSKDIVLLIKDGKKNRFSKISIGKVNYGYNARLFLGDFNSDKISDIFISLCSKKGISKYFYSLISIKQNKVRHLFNQEKFSSGLAFDIDYEDDFKVNITEKEYESVFIADMTSKKEIYVDENIYDSEGKLLKKTKGFYEGLIELKPVDIDKDGVYELKGLQELHGICSADNIGSAKSIWKYGSSKMELLQFYIVPYNKKEIHNNKTEMVLPVIKIQ